MTALRVAKPQLLQILPFGGEDEDGKMK